jgi:IclR family pca regulon transcriptional regulator
VEREVVRKPSANSSGFVNSLARGLAILEAFNAEAPRLGIAEISRKTQLPKSTVYRLIQTLCRLGYVIPVSTSNKYTLGPRVLNLGYAVLDGLELRDVARPYLDQLSKSIGETVNLAILDGWQLVYVERVKTQQIVNINLHIGSRLELYNTSMGRVLSAFQGEDWVSRYLEYLRNIPEAVDYWQGDGAKIRGILTTVRDNDYALNDEELAPGLRSAAAPVRNREGKVVGAVNIAVSSSRFLLEDVRRVLLTPLQKTARAVSAALGYSNP